MTSAINDPKYKKILEVIIFEITKKNAIMYKKEIGKGGFSKVYEVTYKGYILVCKMQILKEKEPTTNVKK
jgi:predicted Ser/Thr protein kinase